MYIPKIGLTHIFFETLQNFQGERLSKIYGIRQKKRHDLPPLQKTGIIIPSNGHPVRFASDRISKILFSCQALVIGTVVLDFVSVHIDIGLLSDRGIVGCLKRAD